MYTHEKFWRINAEVKALLYAALPVHDDQVDTLKYIVTIIALDLSSKYLHRAVGTISRHRFLHSYIEDAFGHCRTSYALI